MCNISSLSVGAHSIVATFGGSSSTNGSASTALLQKINPVGETNVALASSGATTQTSSTYSSSYPLAAINNNERAGTNWGVNGGWAGATVGGPDWVEIDFNGNKNIDRVIVYTVQDNYASPVEPYDSQTFTLYGNTAFNLQSWNGSAWVALGSPVAGNNLVKRAVTFAPTTTSKIRVNITGVLDSFARITEVEVYGSAVTGQAATNTTLVSAPNPSTAGASVTFTATVNGNAPSGPVAFTADGSTLCSAVALHRRYRQRADRGVQHQRPERRHAQHRRYLCRRCRQPRFAQHAADTDRQWRWDQHQLRPGQQWRRRQRVEHLHAGRLQLRRQRRQRRRARRP